MNDLTILINLLDNNPCDFLSAYKSYSTKFKNNLENQIKFLSTDSKVKIN